MSASASAAPMSVDGANATGKKRKEPTAKEVAQAALLEELFDPKNSRVLAASLEKTPPGRPSPAKKPKLAAPSEAEKEEQEEMNLFVAAMDAAMDAAASSKKKQATKPTARTANGAASHATTKAPNLDLFFHLARGYSEADLKQALPAAWEENPETCLKVLMHARDCHGKNGKGERLVVYHALMWLRVKKPRTYLANLITFIGLGYFKDICNLVDMIDGNAPKEHVPKSKKGARGGGATRGGRAAPASMKNKGSIGASFKAAEDAKKAAIASNSAQAAAAQEAAAKRMGPIGNANFELQLFAEYLKADYIKLKKWRNAKKAYKTAQVEREKAQAEAAHAEKLAAGTGAKPLASHKVASGTDWFDVEDDVEELEDGEWTDVGATTKKVAAMEIDAKADAAAAPSSSSSAMVDVTVSSEPVEPPAQCFISLAAKYAPSERHHFASQAKRLAKILFAGEAAQNSAGFMNAKHMQSCLKKYRTMLTTLRSHLCLTEKLACANRWEAINFSAVPSKCHQLLKKAFAKHCGDRYAAYLASLKKGDAGVKINVTGLAPHELVAYYLKGGKLNDTVEEAWKALVAKTAEAGTFAGAVSVVDVSGSMSGLPMNVAIAMGLLVAELCTGVYRGRVLTFHESPSWFTVTGETLFEKVKSIASAPWGGSTNLQATFDLILDVATKHKIAQAHLPQTLFIFSDMQFNHAVGNGARGAGWMATNYDVIKEKYAKAGYAVPSIVFWNLNGALCKDTPIQCDTVGCALMSGFSATLLNVFLSTPIVADPAALTAMDGMDMSDPEVLAAANPLHPIKIMMDSLAGYNAQIDESER